MLKGERIVLCAVEHEDLPRRIQWLNGLTVLEYFGNVLPISLPQKEAWFEKMLHGPSACNSSIGLEGQGVGGSGSSRIDWRNRNAKVDLFMVKPEYV